MRVALYRILKVWVCVCLFAGPRALGGEKGGGGFKTRQH